MSWPRAIGRKEGQGKDWVRSCKNNSVRRHMWAGTPSSKRQPDPLTLWRTACRQKHLLFFYVDGCFFFLKKIHFRREGRSQTLLDPFSGNLFSHPPPSRDLCGYCPAFFTAHLWFVGERNRCFLGTRFPRRAQTAECWVPGWRKLSRWQSKLTLKGSVVSPPGFAGFLKAFLAPVDL